MNQSEKYKAQSTHYLENAFSYIEAGDTEKAGEFLWGSMAQALKAVAASKGIEIRSHRGLLDYARELAKELKDESIFMVSRNAESLHRNFYELGYELEEVYISAEEIKATVGKLLSLIPEEGLTKGS